MADRHSECELLVGMEGEEERGETGGEGVERAILSNRAALEEEEMLCASLCALSWGVRRGDVLLFSSTCNAEVCVERSTSHNITNTTQTSQHPHNLRTHNNSLSLSLSLTTCSASLLPTNETNEYHQLGEEERGEEDDGVGGVV